MIDRDPYGERFGANRPGDVYYLALRWPGHGAPVRVPFAELDQEEEGSGDMRELPPGAGRLEDAASLASIADDLRFLRRHTTPVRGEGGAVAESWANVARALAALGIGLQLEDERTA